MSVLLKKNINPRALSSRPSASTANPYFRCLDTSFEFKKDLAISGFCASSDAEGMYSEPPRKRSLGAEAAGPGSCGSSGAPSGQIRALQYSACKRGGVNSGTWCGSA